MSLSNFSSLILNDLPIQQFSSNDLNVYLQDLINQLLYIKESGNYINIKSFLSKYFEHVINGTHILFREFQYISANSYNRLTFLFNLWNTFHHSFKDKKFINVLMNEFTENDESHENSLMILNKRKKIKSVVNKSDISSDDNKHSHKSVASECCFNRNILIINLPDKYVDSARFLKFTRDLYAESILVLPPKSIVHKYAKTYLFHSELNLYGLFSSLATDQLLMKEIGFPPVYES
ncbi:unnamed protein product [Schistosoma turkestanicum]|nr:unnamed protein product [Schistosoma turkestanicum]